MGSKKKSKVNVSQYYMSLHVGLCLGPVDAVLAAYYGEKQYWSGNNSSNTTYNISNLGLFGGDKKEGGVQGSMTILMGNKDQLIPDQFAVKLGRSSGSDAPGFRGLTTIIHQGSPGTGYAGWLWCSNSPYLKSMWYKVTNIPKTLNIEYSKIGEISTVGKTVFYFNLDTSGSMSGVKLNTLKSAMNSVLIKIRGFIEGGNNNIDIGANDFLGNRREYKNATVNDINNLNSWVQNLTANSGTDFYTAIYPSIEWFKLTANDKSVVRRVNVFITDGEPEPSSSADRAKAAANELITRRIDVDMYGINIELENTYYTGFLDNMSKGNIPVVKRDKPEILSDLIIKGVESSSDANPAHIIFWVLTDPQLGMGLDAQTSINIDSFNKASKTLFQESLGLSMAWSTTTAAQDFINEVVEHANGVIFSDPEDGKINFKLIRDDYSKDNLRVINPDNAKVVGFSRKAWGDTINEIVVTWTNPNSESEETVTLQDNGNIAEQGEVVSDTKNYYGVRSSSLAWKLAERDLRVASAPLCSAEIELDRSFWNIKPGDCVKLTWPDYDLDELIVRVWDVKYGKRGSSKIKIAVTEDVFSLPKAEFIKPPDGQWKDMTAPPQPIVNSKVITVPAYIASRASESSISDIPYPVAYAGILAAAPNSDTFNYELVSEEPDATGKLSWVNQGTRNVCGFGNLIKPLIAEAESVVETLISTTGLGPTVSSFILIGSGDDSECELALVMSHSEKGWLIRRGVLDTVPRAWPQSTPLWFIAENLMIFDESELSAGARPQYKLLSNTSLGQLDINSSPTLTGVLSDRIHAPLRPANVKCNGVLLNNVDAGGLSEVSISWSRRNRLIEEAIVMSWLDGDVTPEDGQITKIEFKDKLGNEALKPIEVLGTSTLANLNLLGDSDEVFVKVGSVRSDIESLQSYNFKIANIKAPLNIEGALAEAKNGNSYNSKFKTDSSKSPIEWGVEKGLLPKGLKFSIDNDNLVISGKPNDEVGDYELSLYALSSNGRIGNKNFALTLSGDVSEDNNEGVVTIRGYLPKAKSNTKYVSDGDIVVSGSNLKLSVASGNLPKNTNLKLENNRVKFENESLVKGIYIFTLSVEGDDGKSILPLALNVTD